MTDRMEFLVNGFLAFDQLDEHYRRFWHDQFAQEIRERGGEPVAGYTVAKETMRDIVTECARHVRDKLSEKVNDEDAGPRLDESMSDTLAAVLEAIDVFTIGKDRRP